MPDPKHLQRLAGFQSERASVAPSRPVPVNTDDPRTRTEFIDDAIGILIPTEPGTFEAYDASKVSGFDIERQPDGNTLDGAIALGLHRYFVAHTDVVKVSNGYDFSFQDYPLDQVFTFTKLLLEDGYRLNNATAHNLGRTDDHLSRYMAIQDRRGLEYMCLWATKRALLVKYYNNIPGNFITRNREQKSVLPVFRSIPLINLSKLAKQ